MDVKKYIKKNKCIRKVFDNNEEYFKFLRRHPEIRVIIVNIEGPKTIIYYEKNEKRTNNIKEKPEKLKKKNRNSINKLMNIIEK